MASDLPLAVLLERASRVTSYRLLDSIGIDGVTAEHWRVLRLLADEQGRTMGWLAEQLGMNPPTLTKLIDRMVAHTFVQRGADPEDSRRVLVYVTDAGLDMLEGLQDRIAQHDRQITALMGEKNLRQLERLLQMLIDGPAASQGVRANRH